MRDNDLHSAAQLDDKQLVGNLIQAGADTEVLNDEGWRPLHVAASRSCLAVLRSLVKGGARVDSTTHTYGNTALHLASSANFNDGINYLVQHDANIERKNSYGFSPLTVAIRNNSLSAAELLLEKGASVSTQDETGQSPLHAAAHSNKEEYAQLLIDNDAQITACDGEGNHPLHIAAKQDSFAVADLLLKHGADAGAINLERRTPLHLAADVTMRLSGVGRSVAVSRLLISGGMGVNAKDGAGKTPLHIASRSSSPNVNSSGDALDIIGMLIETGANIDETDQHGDTPLIVAVSRPSYLPAVELLLRLGAEVNIRGKSGLAPISWATRFHSAELAQILLEYGADPTVTDLSWMQDSGS